ncbi:uncharacterized protein LOC114318011 isoform X1 [Camellia sinensis]|uniref:uncharacterized protein LOC114318011 isoform X1 n=1 Tax=Camellia sinensis TaxID=4442 RepID=UPI00103634A9|nr:uncharacterized protein LOC114318011 isoform X1 [Camellia sinensis]
MSQNRSFQDGSQHQSTMDSAFTRLQQGLMMTPESEIQHVIEPFLEPLVLKIVSEFSSANKIQQLEDGKGDNKTSEDDVSSLKKVVEVMVIQRVHHVIEPLMEHLLRKAAKVVIESVVDKVLTRNSGNEMHSSEPRILQLRFQTLSDI